MLVDNTPYRTIWLDDDERTVVIIDQTKLPHHFVTTKLRSLDDASHAISSMQVRGAPLIGATAAYGFALACTKSSSDTAIAETRDQLINARPTAINLAWAAKRLYAHLVPLSVEQRTQAAYDLAAQICDEDAQVCESIGDHGLGLIKDIAAHKTDAVNILTHCNAGWLATVDWGTALAPIYKAHDAGIDVHVWVDETRPRNQGAFLTAWELASHNVPHTVITDNAGGHLMQHGLVDMCMVGTDRTTATGDVCNKIGTYLKALAAKANNVPFYVCLPSSTVDWEISDGVREIPIEQRSSDEIRVMQGLDKNNELTEIELFPSSSPIRNDAFDTTPAELVSGLITERGIAQASRSGLAALFPELAVC